MKLKKFILLLPLILLVVQCSPGKFKGASGVSTAPPPPPATIEPYSGTVDLSCEETSEKSIRVGPQDDMDIKVQDDAQVSMSVKGRFCPTVSNNLTVLFVIDFSGSMGPNSPDASNRNYQPATGNDPRTKANSVASCGRLQAVEAVIAKFKEGDNIKVGTVAFAGGIVGSHTKTPVDAATFKSTQLAEASKLTNFCSYVAPDISHRNQEMAIKNANVTGMTNYAAAFNRAYDYLKNVSGRKVVYFITDGRPTAGGFDPLQAGQNAAAKLKTIENLYFNAFFLQYTGSGLQEDTQGFENLVQTVGAPEHVVRVDSADKLAEEVSKDLTVSFDPSQISASLSIEPNEPQTSLNVLSFAQDPANANAWLFETDDFTLQGAGKNVYTHVLKVSAKATDGTSHTSFVKILYQKSLSSE